MRVSKLNGKLPIKPGAFLQRTSGTSSLSSLSKISKSTLAGVLGLMAIPALSPCWWMYLTNSFGLVFLSDVAEGSSAAVELTAAS